MHVFRDEDLISGRKELHNHNIVLPLGLKTRIMRREEGDDVGLGMIVLSED